VTKFYSEAKVQSTAQNFTCHLRNLKLH